MCTKLTYSQIDSAWVKKYAGAVNNDEAKAVFIDASGNVYVTGRSMSMINGYDIVTVKYNTSGTVLWTAVFNGSGNSTDEGNDIASDGTNIYVCGVTTRSPSTGLDYITIKYNASTGAVLWSSVYNGAGNLDDVATHLAYKNGRIYITGKGYYRSNTDGDYVTIKYNSTTGDSIWVKNYNGPSSGNDSATCIRISSDTSVYISGKSYGTGNNDIATVKYSSTGTQSWFKRVNGSANGEDLGKFIVFDQSIASPNIFVISQSEGSGTGSDIMIIRYTTAGVETWKKTFNAAGSGDDIPNSAYWRSDNEIYITGKAVYGGSVSDMVLLKYDLNGDTLWTRKYNGTANGNDEGYSVITDASGYVYIAGKGNETLTGNDYVVCKYTSGGNLEWTYKFNKSGNNPDIPSALSVDATTDRNVFVTGAGFSGTSGTNYTTIKLKQDKVLDLNVWVQGFYNPVTNSTVKDTIRVFLYNSAFTLIIDSSKTLIDSLGKGRLYFKTALNGTSYRLVVKHRNSIETWATSNSTFSSLYLTYDFTTALNKAYGNNMIQVDASPLEFAIYNGDVNQDGIVEATDLSLIDNDAANFTGGYVSSDINGDGTVDGTDALIAGNNSDNFVSVVRP